jgi:ParB-like chromosome segregation protein Spo0J
MRLTEIKLDADLWPRSREEKETVDHYVEIFEELPPIAVQRGTGKLIDGWHRFYAASKLGLSDVQIEEVDVPDNLLFAEAVKRNLKHGVPLKRQERERAIIKLSQDGLSIRQICEVLGCGIGSVSRVLKAAKAETGSVPSGTLPLLHRVSIANAPPEMQPEIAKAVVEKKLTEKETKRLVEAMTSSQVTDEDLNAMLHDPITRPYLRDQKGEKIQSLDSAMREIESVKKQADRQSTVKFWKTLQQLHKELSSYKPEEIVRDIDKATLPLALETANWITRWFETFRFECAKVGLWQKQPGE